MKFSSLSKKFILPLFLLSFSFLLYPFQERELSDVKLLIFDRKWKEAETKIMDILRKYPESESFSDILFYLGQCIQEQGGREEEAINTFKRYLKKREGAKFAEEAEIAIIDLSSELYKKGKKNYIDNIKIGLESKNRVIRYYSAFKLSYFKEGEKFLAVPVLMEILKEEKDEELKERAKIALLRIDPYLLKGIKDEESKIRMLRIAIFKRSTGKQELSIKIPVELANLAIQAISKPDYRIKGDVKIDGKRVESGTLAEIFQKFLNMKKAELLEIYDEDEIIKIWIE
jgi:tetratricopeptide (TPR) repeat protein